MAQMADGHRTASSLQRLYCDQVQVRTLVQATDTRVFTVCDGDTERAPGDKGKNPIHKGCALVACSLHS